MLERTYLETTRPQPMPAKNDNGSITELVREDLKERERQGIKKYGVTLQPFNDRRSIIDSYQEVLDLAQYLRQKIEEENTLDEYIQFEYKRAVEGRLDEEMFSVILLKILQMLRGRKDEKRCSR